MTKPKELKVGDRVVLIKEGGPVDGDPPKGTKGTVISNFADSHAPAIPIAWDDWEEGWVSDKGESGVWLWNAWSVERDHLRKLPDRKEG